MIPPNILNLPSYHVTALEEDEHHYHVQAQVAKPPTHCIHCAQAIHGFGRREQLVKDLPMHGKRVGLYITRRRFQCQACHKTFYEPLPDTDKKRNMTKRLADWIGRQSIRRTFAGIAEETGVVEGTVRSIFRDYINELEKTVRIEIPQWMGIDEIHLIKPRCVISNIRNNTIVDILKNRNKETVINYLHRLDGHKQVQYVAMDMWRPYKEAVETVLPDAQIIIDKFHVLRLANNDLEKARKNLRSQLNQKQRRTLMHDRFILLKRRHKLTSQEILLLDGWCSNYPELGSAYQAKETFYQIYEAKTPEEAKSLFETWQGNLAPEIKEHYGDLIRAWQNWESCICNYFDHPITNAYTESLNNLIRVINRLGRGYSFDALRAKILFSHGEFKTEKKRPGFQRYRPDEKVTDISSYHGVSEPAKPYKEKPGKRASTQDTKYYGVDIPTLTQTIEKGLLS